MRERMRYSLKFAGLMSFAIIFSWGCSSADDSETDQPAAALLATGFQVTSPNFTDIRPKIRIPEKNTCYGDSLSPPLDWVGAPEGTESYALIVEDIDHDAGTWVYWVMYNIPADATGLAEGIATSTAVLPDGTTQGTNDQSEPGYSGVCPPRSLVTIFYTSGEPPHRYYFRLYALDAELVLAPGATKDELVIAMEGHVLAQAETMGKYTTPLGLVEKEGAGFMQTTKGEEAHREATQIPVPYDGR